MLALRNHFKGHGNKAKLKAEAVALKNTLHYKNEKALTFDTYLQRVQKMIHLFEQAEEPMTTSSQLDFMLDNILDESLSSTVSAVKSAIAVKPTSFNLTSAYNHISAEVKKINVPAKRGISGTSTTEGSRDVTNKVKTDTLPPEQWHALSFKEKRAIEEARRAKDGGRGRGNNRKNNNNGRKDYKRLERQVKSLKKQRNKDKRKISSLTKEKGDDDGSNSSDSDESSAAGTKFGGRESVVRWKDQQDKKKKAKKSG
jgi:hypothetical protein